MGVIIQLLPVAEQFSAEFDGDICRYILTL